FTRDALREIGAAITIFQVKHHAREFLAMVDSDAETVEDKTSVVETVAKAESELDEHGIDEPRASQIDRQTKDYVLETLHKRITDREFELFTADLLRTLGYQARVTRFSRDGNVDVIAHRDALGLEPPQIKVQCKHTTNTIGAPDVQQLTGTAGPGEYGLFVTLGAYSTDALAIERQRPQIRLLNGEDIVELVIANYAQLPERWRLKIALTPVLVVADDAIT
ncbi:MAG: restriction endonuclease, partial [Micrococcales bacterium]|nr:restriction endonuclease [Micrococcales bacterium]